MKADRRSQPWRDHLGQDSGGLNGLRSPSVSAGEAALKGLGELPSPVEKAEEQPERNLYPLRGTVLFYEDPFESAIPVEDWEVLR
jgi:hypothetical protein